MSEAPLEPESPLWEEASPRPRTPWVTYGVLVACIAIWAGIWYSGDPDSEEVLYRHGYADGWEIWDGAWWSLITAAFVHVDTFHLLFNMLWLWILGRVLERSIGPARWLGFIVLTAFVTSAAELAASEDTPHGFSGVLCAVFGFMWLALRRYPSFAIVKKGWMVSLFLGGLVLALVADAMGLDDVANFTHLSGLMYGVLMGYAVLHTAKRIPAVSAIALLTLASFVPLFWMPWSPWWTTYKGVQAHYEDENLEEAIAWYRKALELGPYNVEWVEGELAVAKARLAHLEGRYEDALRWYRRVIELEHDDGLAWAWSNLAIIQSNAGEHDAAERSLTRLAEYDEQAATAERAGFHGDKAADEGRLKDAIERYRKAIEWGHYEAEWTQLKLADVEARLAHREERYEDALRWYRRALELGHYDPAWAWSNIAIIQWDDDEYDAAERSLDKMGEHEEKKATALRAALRGDKAFDEERFEDAMRLLQRSVDLGEDTEWVHVVLVNAYGKLGDLDKRAQALKRLRELHPDAEVEPAPTQPQKAPVEISVD